MRNIYVSLFTFLLFLSGPPLSAQPPKKNVVVLIADDFNFWLKEIGYYPDAQTPNLDKLARKGVLFTDAHSASPVCNPSRNALLSGYRPSTTGIAGNSDGYVRDVPGFGNIVTLNQYFTNNGYHTLAGGKIYHPGKMGSTDTDPTHWSEIMTQASGAPGGSFYKYAYPNPQTTNQGLFNWSAGVYDISTAADTKLATFFANRIANYHTSPQSNKPFFFACGVFRPHLPWNAPKQFYDLFDPATLPTPQGYKAGDLSDISGATSSEEFDQIVGDGKWKEAIRAYLANLAYADYNVGLVLDALENSPQKDNTIVVFFGDHGWHLGEKDRFSKHALYEMAGWTSLIIYDPSAPANGQACEKVVSLQDIYPTLVELAGLPTKTNIEGRSLAPLLRNPQQPGWNLPILMTFGGANIIKTDQWRLVDDGTKSQLYNMQTDPYEWTNLYGQAAYNPIVTRLRSQIDSIVAVGTYLKNNGFVAPANALPAITVSAPASVTTNSVPLTATATDSDGSVAWVEFFNGSQYLGSDHTAPYNFTWNNVPAGSYTITARATDNKGAFRNSTAISVTVGGSTPACSTVRTQAESFATQSGVQAQSTYLGFVNNGDWADYSVNVPCTGTYTFRVRVASKTAGGTLTFWKGTTNLGSVTVTNTSGWTTWVNKAVTVNLTEGVQTFRLAFSGSGTGYLYNVDWFEIQPTSASRTTQDSAWAYPNPVTDWLTLGGISEQAFVQIFDHSGKEMTVSRQESGIQVSHLAPGLYMLVVDGKQLLRFTKQ